MDDYRDLPYLSMIEGRRLGNGKTVLAVILAQKWRLQEPKTPPNIVTNIKFKGIKYELLESESQLFDVRDSIIIIDEFDQIAKYNDRESGDLYYDHLIKYCRKYGNIVIFITQMAHMLPRKMRAMMDGNGIICFPQISPYLRRKNIFNWIGKEINSRVTKQSRLYYQWFYYNDSICRSQIGYENLIPYSEKYSIGDLPHYFKFYSTWQKDFTIEKIERKSEKKKRERLEFLERKEEKEKGKIKGFQL